METPKTKAGRLTEQIMTAFSRHSEQAIVPLETPEYNRVYEHVFKVLQTDEDIQVLEEKVFEAFKIPKKYRNT